MTVAERYKRNFKILSKQEQSTLGKSKVCIVGLGGLGGGVLEMLTRIGVGNLYLVDGDCFEATNLNRQVLSSEENLGLSKADAALERVREINSSTNVKIFNAFLNKDNSKDIIGDADLVIDCLDSVDARFLLEDAAKKALIPLVSGAIAGASGQVTTIFPEDKGFELIYGKQTKKSVKGIENQLGNLSFCALFIASIQASEAVKVLLKRGHLLKNKLLIADLMSNTFEVIELQ